MRSVLCFSPSGAASTVCACLFFPTARNSVARCAGEAPSCAREERCVHFGFAICILLLMILESSINIDNNIVTY